jgi:endonuclease YncB( thermonuclease family)
VRRRRRRQERGGFHGAVIILAILLLVTVVAGIPYAIASRDARRPQLEEAPTRLNLAGGTTLTGLQEVRVYEVIDGDTIDVELDGTVFRVRYYGVDTPERGDRCFREAADRNESLVGERVLLHKAERDSDRFGRLLRYVFRPDGVSVDATLVAEGFARAWSEDGIYRDQIMPLEDQARQASRGCLWR